MLCRLLRSVRDRVLVYLDSLSFTQGLAGDF